MQPRIYTYKITFEEVPYYYYGSKKEKYFNEEYWGSPVTNKWCWELYTPKKQILELFDFTDEGYIECLKIEGRLIKPVLNDFWCLNESCGGNYSLATRRKSAKNGAKKLKELGIGIFALSHEELSEIGKKGAAKVLELKVGIHGRTKEEMSENGRKGGKIAGKISGPKTYELGVGVHGLTPEQRTENGKKGAEKCKQLGVGIVALTPEQLSENGKKGGALGGKIGGKISGKLTYELGIGIHGLTPEQRMENAIKGGKLIRELGKGIFALTKEQRSENGRITANKKWRCLETGHISNAAGLAIYQRARGIDTSLRERIS
jgi:general stress protein YciG